MSSLWLTKLIQRDKNLKNTLVFSHNYKNRYLKKKNLKLSQNRIPNNKNKGNLKHLSNQKKTLQSENMQNFNYSRENNLNSKNEIINGGENTQKISYYNSNIYDKSGSDSINNNIYGKTTYNSNQKSLMINGKNNMDINLKKYINSNKGNYKYNLDTLSRKYYFSTEKIMNKINLNELNNNLKYLKLNTYRASSYEKRGKNNYREINFMKSPTNNFTIENIDLNTIPLELKTNNFKSLTKDTREQFSMEKNKYRKFNGLKEEDNILINYFPLMKNKNDNLIVNSNQIEFSVIKNNNNSKTNESEKKIKEIIITNPLKEKKEKQNNINDIINNAKSKEDKNEKKEINLEEKTNNNSKQFNKFKEKFKKKLEDDADKKNDRFKISVKIKNLALGLENQFKINEDKKKEKNQEEKLTENEFELDSEKIKEKIPIIYKKKKHTKVVFNDK